MGQVKFGDGVYDGKLLIKVQRGTNRLYKLCVKGVRGDCLLSKVEDETRLWNLRLGHVNFTAMQLMSRKQMVWWPTKNGVVERRNRTVVAMGRSMLKEWNVPSEMWGEALDTQFMYSTNCPLEPSQKSRLTRPAYMKIPNVYVKKLDDRSKRVVYFGREPGTKAHRLEKSWSWNHSESTSAEVGKFIVVGIEDIEPEAETADSEDTIVTIPQSSSRTSSQSQTATPQINASVVQSTESRSEINEGSISATSSESSAPLRFRNLNDIYAQDEDLELIEELHLLSIDEPVLYEQATKSRIWKDAMKAELDAIEKNRPWEEVYVAQPKGYVKRGQESKVYRLLKALYGLRQERWNRVIGRWCLRDDLLITGTSTSHIINFKEQMGREFEMSDLGRLTYYLGLEVEQGQGFIELKQTAYAKKILEKAGMSDCNPVRYPMETEISAAQR
ncbi:uncharacterized protein LOC141704843 [Apium graveolens]|uniref:uncharacterized protein LOC141704843 n=1 Tax=Apium graveolens TaxID=4045 RepID=UPI003D7B93E9